MADTLESLEIEVKHSASGAAEEIRDVTSAVRSLGKALDKVIPNLRTFNEALGGSSVNVTNNNMTQVADTINNVNQAASKSQGATTSAAKGVKELSKEVGKSNGILGTFARALGRIAMYRFLRSIIKAVTQAFSEGLEKAYLFSSGIEGEGHRFAEALDSMKSATNSMKGQLGSAFISLLAAIEPILLSIINLITQVADAISQFFSAFTGTTYLKAEKTAAKFADNMARGGAAAKEWKNQLLGFDEINRLNEPSSGGGGGGGSDPMAGYKFNDTPLSDWAKKFHDNLALFETVSSGLALMLGSILLFSGANIPLGLGLIALGAAGLANALKEDWSSVDTKIATIVHHIMTVVGIGLLAVGAVLTFTGNLPIGLGLMAAGAASLASAAVIRWGLVDEEVGNSLTKVARTASWATFAVGAILALSGVATPLGLAMMGASVIAQAATLDWDNILKSIKEAWRKIKDYFNENIKKYFTKEWWQGQINEIAPDWGSVFGGIIDWCISAHKAIQDVLDGIGLINGGSHSQFAGWASDVRQFTNPGQFASGGYPESGQLFFANESGAGAELVGTVGGRTAVASNNDILEGIRQGVYDAVTAAMAGNQGNDRPIKVYLDSREIKSGLQRLDRAWGV